MKPYAKKNWYGVTEIQKNEAGVYTHLFRYYKFFHNYQSTDRLLNITLIFGKRPSNWAAVTADKYVINMT